jgi:hypothetical protein
VASPYDGFAHIYVVMKTSLNVERTLDDFSEMWIHVEIEAEMRIEVAMLMLLSIWKSNME